MMHNNEQLHICTLNCHGLKGNVLYVEYIMKKYNIIFLSEHWIIEKDKFIFDKLCLNHNILFLPAQTHLNSKGRPFGGLVWLVSKNIKIVKYEFISDNLTTLEIRMHNTELMFIGIYAFYNNNSIANFICQENLFDNCNQIMRANLQKNIFLLGDFNSDPYRLNRFDKIFQKFINSSKLSILSVLQTQNSRYTFNSGFTNSLIDHIVAADSNFKNITPICNIIDDTIHSLNSPTSINLSDHCLVELVLTFDDIETIPSQENCNQELKWIPNWKNEKVSKKFMEILDNLQSKINVDLAAFDLMNEDERQNSVDRLYSEITNNFKLALDSVNCENKPRKNQTWWSEELLSIKNKIRLELKKRNNMPNHFSNTYLKDLKKKFRKIQRKNIYLYENNKVKNIDNLFKIKNKNKFWKEIKKLKTKKIDTFEEIDKGLITEHFKKIFSEDLILSESQKIIHKAVDEYHDELKKIYKNEKNPKIFRINKDNLKSIINEFNASNTQGIDGISYNMLRICGNQTLDTISQLFNFILNFAIIPKNFNISIIKPIQKDTKKLEFDVNNIRPISISNCLAQIFEKIIVSTNQGILKVNQNQFGFRKGLSTIHPLFILKESSLWCKQDKSPCYIASLDAAKAFDSVWRIGLFHKLKDKLCPKSWLSLYNYYSVSFGCLDFSGKINKNSMFQINKGVKQGGVISPLLFNIYIDDLINKVVNSDYGLSIKDCKISIMAYCDDIIILSSSLFGMQKLLEICSEYGADWNIKFNPLKSCILQTGRRLYKDKEMRLFLNRIQVPVVSETKYLGLMMKNSLNFNEYIENKFKEVRKAYNSLYNYGTKPNGLNPFTKAHIYKSLCLPKSLYGLGVITVPDQMINKLELAQNLIIRNTLGLTKFNHMSEIKTSLKIESIKSLYLQYKCILINLLNRHQLTKSLLSIITNSEYKTCKLSLNKDIDKIAIMIGKDSNFICEQPSMSRSLIKQKILSEQNLDPVKISTITNLLINYNKVNKHRLRQITFLFPSSDSLYP
jgi:hypothetical protein